jgi:hypothetical protein
VIKYPVYASDFLDMSHCNGKGSVAGLVDDADHIILGYGAELTYNEAKELAEILNKIRVIPGKKILLALARILKLSNE